MAIHVSTLITSERRHVARCYCGPLAERFVREKRPDAFFNGEGHLVEIPYDRRPRDLGWGLRAGRLPICPEHRRPDDVDY